MYVSGNPKTKKELKQWVSEGRKITIFAPGLGQPKTNGREHVEGPHFPKPHMWYTDVELKDGYIVKVL